MFSRKKITFHGLLALSAMASLLSTSALAPSFAAPTEAASPKTPAKKDAAKDDKKGSDTAASTKPPDSVLENAQQVTPLELVDKPHEYLGKNVKFTANFYAFSNLALDYKPAYKSSKTHLSLLILKPNSHIPLSELKLAMMIPKDKDPETELLAKLKDGDQVEIVGKEFSTALDDPWVEIYKLKKIGGSKDDDKDKDKKAAADKGKSDKADDKSDSDSKTTK